MDVGKICDYIILVSAVLIAIKNIYEFFAKPTSIFKSKRAKVFREQIGEVVAEKTKEAITKYDEEISVKMEQEHSAIKETIKSEVFSEIKPALDAIIAQNEAQNESIKILTSSSKDMLRQRIMTIYHANKRERSLSYNDNEVLQELYKDYKAQGGNSYIDKYYGRMSKWETRTDDYDDEVV